MSPYIRAASVVGVLLFASVSQAQLILDVSPVNTLVNGEPGASFLPNEDTIEANCGFSAMNMATQTYLVFCRIEIKDPSTGAVVDDKYAYKTVAPNTNETGSTENAEVEDAPLPYYDAVGAVGIVEGGVFHVSQTSSAFFFTL